MALDSRLVSLKDAIKEDWAALEVEENEEGFFVRLKVDGVSVGKKNGHQELLPNALALG